MTTPNKTFLLLLETLLLWLEQTQNRVNDQFVCVISYEPFIINSPHSTDE